MAALAHAELFVLSLGCFALFSGVSWSLLAPSLSARLGGWAPARRHAALWLLCAAPLLTTIALFLAAIAPAAWSLVDASYDHCLVHDDGHAHLCFVHGPRFPAHAALWVLATFVGSQAALALARVAVHAARQSAVVRALVRTGVCMPDGSVELDTTVPLCVSAGLFRPRVLLSPGLVRALDARQLEAVLAHEAEHVRRRDALSNLVAGIVSVLYLPKRRRELLRALRLAAEEACDEAAAHRIGDRTLVAQAILAVARLGEPSTLCAPLVTLGMAELAIEARVRALLAERRVGGSLFRVLLLVAALVVPLAWGADALHHMVESRLSSFLS